MSFLRFYSRILSFCWLFLLLLLRLHFFISNKRNYFQHISITLINAGNVRNVYTKKRNNAWCFYKFLATNQCGIVLVDFHIWIDFPYKETRSDVTNCATNDAKRSTKQCHVSEVKCGLEQTVHSMEMKREKKRGKNINKILFNINCFHMKMHLIYFVLKKK